MLELNWKVPQDINFDNVTKIAVLITDAPCHGKEFHKGVLDNFEDLTKKPEADIRPLFDQMIQKNINLSIIEINEKTNKMVEVVKDYYQQKDKSLRLETVILGDDPKNLIK